MFRKSYLILAVLLSFCGQVYATPDQQMTIAPAASSGGSITAADENDRNNDISSPYNSHNHVDISSMTSVNTFTIGDNAVGNKTFAVDTDQANMPGLRYNTTTDLWTLSNDGASYLASAHAADGGGLVSGALLYGAGSGAIGATSAATNGQILIGSTSNNPSLGTISAGIGVTVTNAPGSITVSSIKTSNTIAADDTTPSVSAGSVFTTSANIGATAITDLDDPTVGQIVYLIGGSDTNSSTIADSGNFNLSASFTASLDDVLIIYVQADNDYIEIGRVNN